jgi:hypothetical protein
MSDASITLSEAEARGIACVLKLCDVIIVRAEFSDEAPEVYDPEEVRALLDEMDDYRDLLLRRLKGGAQA